ncbi:helix-turn-helix domain-containing protein [Nocardia sp. NPDC005978]|uniref:helix-turn-helix domain-containing protein n=1 Tax=Nocardia sp. NPDC005978 TaxID=3156725 RepID=UPI0033BA6AAC
MADAHLAIASYLREARESAGLTRAELARRAGVSEALIQKLEQGTRPPTPTALGALFDALDVPVQYRDHAAKVLQPELSAHIADEGAPDAAEMAFLHSLPYPACYQTVPALDVVAANDAYLRVFPGLGPGANVMEWMLLDPRARVALRDWERETRSVVHAFRHMAPGLVEPARIEQLTRLFAEHSPDWDRFRASDIPSDDQPRRPIAVRSPETGEWVEMTTHVFRFELPRRHWCIYSLVPVAAPN